MTKALRDILDMARRFKACGKADGITDIRNAVDTLLSPQGREFAMNTGYPTLDALRSVADEIKDDARVFVDRGKVYTDSYDSIAAGNTELTIDASGTERLYHVIAMHGAKVNVNASRYAVVSVTAVDAEVVIDSDGTAYVSEERKEVRQ